MFKQIQILLRICPFSNLLRKTNFLYNSVHLSERVPFCIKRKVLCEFLPKYFRTTEKHSLGVWDSLYGEKHFFLIFPPIYRFDQEQLFKQIQIFYRIYLFKHFEKKSSLNISVLLSEIVNFWTKKWSSLWFYPKILQNNRKV